jgi:HD-like signal output (HDOD) protein
MAYPTSGAKVIFLYQNNWREWELGLEELEQKESEARIQKLLEGVIIPPCPALLIKVLQEARHPEARLGKIADIVLQDAGLAAALLKLANSPYFKRGEKITSVHQAVTLLGLKATLNLLSHAALLQSMQDNPPNFEKFWERSALVAAVCEFLARKITQLTQTTVSEDDAYITGLFHDSGIPVLMRKFPGYRDRMIAEANMGLEVQQVEDEHFYTDHAVVGSMMARTWYLPESVCIAIRYHHDPTLFTAPRTRIDRESTSLAAIVNMAEMLINTHFCQPYPDWARIEVFVLHHFGLAPRDFGEIKADALHWLAGTYIAA